MSMAAISLAASRGQEREKLLAAGCIEVCESEGEKRRDVEMLLVERA
jgi:hypothetical protein